ncbi:MAG: hypothetical protein UV57_C0002G0002 [Parcubacteria group bacterium GW2011_GWD2_43_10]|nr:MAG: hypothetical protein UV52_C0005G0001 [Parcubacteria group bacterium GW2011_GWD1_42_9]KKS84041.1 MAG: hypothetical protein UV57_C0002G0002 [Parcubacteria group bacterium GW2011_GWD2_43_10]
MVLETINREFAIFINKSILYIMSTNINKHAIPVSKRAV